MAGLIVFNAGPLFAVDPVVNSEQSDDLETKEVINTSPEPTDPRIVGDSNVALIGVSPSTEKKKIQINKARTRAELPIPQDLRMLQTLEISGSNTVTE